MIAAAVTDCVPASKTRRRRHFVGIFWGRPGPDTSRHVTSMLPISARRQRQQRGDPVQCRTRLRAASDADVMMSDNNTENGTHVLRAGSTPAPVDPLACLLQEAQRRHFELVTWSTECL